MDSTPSHDVIEPLRNACHQLAAGVTAMHPFANQLEQGAPRAEILRALFEITRQVEIVKKQLQRAERRDDTKLL
jgi:hypothetical protein